MQDVCLFSSKLMLATGASGNRFTSGIIFTIRPAILFPPKHHTGIQDKKTNPNLNMFMSIKMYDYAKQMKK
jgi:hypothetical protein